MRGSSENGSRLWVVAYPTLCAVGMADMHLAFGADAGGVFAHWISIELGISGAEQEDLVVAGQLRDVGMLGALWRYTRPGPMTPEERREMQQHPVGSEGVVRALAAIEPRFDSIATTVRHHHERWDGCGYPDGLAGDAIPRGSRVISVADAFVAMRLGLPWREALPVRVARLRLAQAAETQFDPAIVEAFERVVRRQAGGEPLEEWPYVIYSDVGQNLLQT
jgi:HD-GYP domain-containing protein (c-di-GMP phosphodiesterase class II)